MPLGLLTLAAGLSKKGYIPAIFRPEQKLFRNEDFQTVAQTIANLNYRLIGFSTWCITYPASLLIAQSIKRINPQTTIVFGGPQASILAKETLEKFTFVDFVLSGEADFTFSKFLTEWEKDSPEFQKIKGLSYKNESGRICTTKHAEPVKNLNNLPIPAYKLVPKSKSLKLDVGRGCPFHCTFCSTSQFFAQKYRVKSPERILQEIKLAAEQSKITAFSFAHDMFTLNKKFINELCSKLIQFNESKSKKITWTCSARIDCVNAKMLSQMKRAGCQAVFFGIESGSEKIQKNIRKNLNLDQALQIADVCRETGINMHASFIIGFPDETNSDVEETLQCALKLALKGALIQISELSLLPGTPLYNTYKNQLRFDGQFSNFSNAVCGKEELLLILKFPELFSSFYYLPVSTLSRGEITFLSHLINNLHHFRNTVFLLRNLIEQDSKMTNLLDFYKKAYQKIRDSKSRHPPVVSFWIDFFKHYLSKNKEKINRPEIYAVFALEAFQSLLKAKYTRWHLVRNLIKEIPGNKNKLKPTPVWNILTTSFKLEKTVPSENKWNAKTHHHHKRIYHYLLVADSENTCIRKKISSRDFYLFQHLEEKTTNEFLKEVRENVPEDYSIKWLKKVQKLGVLETAPSFLKKNNSGNIKHCIMS